MEKNTVHFVYTIDYKGLTHFLEYYKGTGTHPFFKLANGTIRLSHSLYKKFILKCIDTQTSSFDPVTGHVSQSIIVVGKNSETVQSIDDEDLFKNIYKARKWLKHRVLHFKY